MTFGRKGAVASTPQTRVPADLQALLVETENSRAIALAAQQANPALSFPSNDFPLALQGLEQVKQMIPVLDQQIQSTRSDPAMISQGTQHAIRMLNSCKAEFDNFTGEMLARESIFERSPVAQSASSPDRSSIHCALLDLAYERFDQIEQSIAAMRLAKQNLRAAWPQELDLDGIENNRVSFKATLERYNALLIHPGDTFTKPSAAALSRLIMVFELMIEKFNIALQNLVVSQAMHAGISQARQQGWDQA